MPKKRKTKTQKIRSAERNRGGFSIKSEWLKTSNGSKEDHNHTEEVIQNKRYFKADLTKTLVLTMLVLALELALWQYLTRLT